MRIAFLYTTPLEDNEDVGRFELEVHLHDNLIKQGNGVKELVNSTISAHLAAAIQSSEVPVEYWRADFNQFLQTEFNFPQTCTFDRRKMQ